MMWLVNGIMIDHGGLQTVMKQEDLHVFHRCRPFCGRIVVNHHQKIVTHRRLSTKNFRMYGDYVAYQRNNESTARNSCGCTSSMRTKKSDGSDFRVTSRINTGSDPEFDPVFILLVTLKMTKKGRLMFIRHT